MKYVDLLEFCRLMIDTEADETSLRDYHVKPDGPISKVWGEIDKAIKTSKDFNYRGYLQDMIDKMNEAEDDYTKPPPNKLH